MLKRPAIYLSKQPQRRYPPLLKKISPSLEEVPDSPEESYFASSTRDGLRCISAQASVPDDEMPHDDPVATWSTISREAKSLLHLNGIASVSSSHSSALSLIIP
ncbi:unnamed protein product [Brassica rapa subsp. trilocularis]